MSEHFKSADPKMDIWHTNYFNHSFAPDIVLSWPGESQQRLVFIRPNADPTWMLDDLQWLTQKRPIIMTLEPSPIGSHPEGERLAARAQDSDTLVTDVDGIDQIHAADDPVLDLLAHAVLRGGRGVLGESAARDVSTLASEGFRRAQELDVAATSAAVGAIGRVLEPGQSGRMTRVLQAVWEGHGGSAANFPSRQGLGGTLTTEDLALLLNVVVSEKLEFWRRVSRNVSLDQLADLELEDPSENLQRLVKANLDRLPARAVRVLVESDYLGEPSLIPRWKVDRGCLALRGWAWSAYFASTRDRLPAATESVLPSVRGLRERVDAEGSVITNIQVRDRNLSITYESTTEDDVMSTKQVDEIARRADALAVRATFSSRWRRRVTCEFESSTAGGATSSTYDLGELARLALPVLIDLDDAQRRQLGELVRSANPQEDMQDELPF
ncbi:hypothetical protein ABN034_12885 [Actinopolymorpha sp. B11F2]|uniref:hypothetical protein n=1 Tax=Actinopolymorpha sp. B11F2 TaxID=3160862 RepID=UPI0032E39447